MSTIANHIKNRRSVFPVQFNDKEVSPEEIKTILEAANWAPTHKKTEPWRFKVVRGKRKTEFAEFLAKKYEGTTKKFSERKQEKIRQKINQSSAVIGIFLHRDPKERIPEWEEIASMAAAVQNMWLTATDIGLAGYWSSPKLIHQVDDFFNLMPNETCRGFFYLGKTDEELPEGERQAIAQKVEWL